VHPSGPWYDISDMVVDLDNNIIMKRKRVPGEQRRLQGRLTKVELREFKRAPNVTAYAENFNKLKTMSLNNGEIQDNGRPRRRRKKRTLRD
jgi:hypothetical protein